MRRKKEQIDRYSSGITAINPPPSLNIPKQGSINNKQQTAEEKDKYMEALIDQFKIRLSSEIEKCNKNEQELDKLYNKLLQSTRLPKGVVDAAEKKLNAPNSITNMLKVKARKTEKKSIDYWKDFVKDNFEELKKFFLKVGDEGKDKVNEYSSGKSDENNEEEIRAFSTSLDKIIRADLPPQIKQIFMDTINTHLEQISNYMSDFSVKILETSLIFSENSFVPTGDGFELVPQTRKSIAHILPHGYLQEDIVVSNPLDAELLKNEEFTSNYNRLFQDSHLELIHSTYYGAIGTEASSLAKSPLHKAIIDVIPPSTVNHYRDIPSHSMKMARQLYQINFRQMWSDKTIANKTLNRLLRSLLIIHLAPKRDREFKERKSKRQNKCKGKQARRVTNCSIPEPFISMKNKTRNGIRRLFSTEEKNKLKFQTKGRVEKAERCQLRIDTYRAVLRREAEERETFKAQQRQQTDSLTDHFDREEFNDEVVGDTTLRRIKRLLQIAKSALFSDQVITRARLWEMDSDFTQREVDAMIKILNFLKPYIPSKVNYSSFPYQLPFVLMANQVLKAIGYEGQTVKFVPIINPSTLHAFLIDTTTLYSLFCSKKAQDRMYIQDFKGNTIKSITALANKDAVFSSFFDIHLLKEKAADYGLVFSNRIHILPGLKTVRVYGTCKKSAQAQIDEAPDKPKYQEGDSTTKAMNDQKSALQKKLKDQVKQLDVFLLGNDSVRALKRKWRLNVDGEREKWYTKVEATKVKKRELMIAIRDTKQAIQSIKRQIYDYRHPVLPTPDPPDPFIVDNKPCLRKVESFRLSNDIDLKEAVFSGTDNGIIKTTETAYFDIDRFTFHLKLYNRFQILEDPMDIDVAEDKAYLDLPPTLVTTPRDINQGTGLKTYTRSLTRKKKTTLIGHQVLDAEEELSRHSLYNSKTPEELEESYTIHTNARNILREFYYSRSNCSNKRRLELKKRRYYDKNAAFERKFSGKNNPVMFVGDRGFGIGSSIKGHQRFGGFQKQDRHGRNTATLITNEYNSSQTCLFCFNKLSHPVSAADNHINVTKGTFVCLNANCAKAFTPMCRDKLSALAIGLAGLSYLLFGSTFPCFDEKSTRTSKERFFNSALDFLHKKQRMGSPADGGNTL